MIQRHIIQLIIDRAKRFPVVGVIGPRQVGKTTLVKSILKVTPKDTVYLDMELPSDLNQLREPELYFKENIKRTVVLDEIQHKPGLFPVMRSVIDVNRKPGRFIVTGSASPDLLQQGSETLAGRIIFCELGPLSLVETKYMEYQKLWLRGGFPGAYLAKSNKDSFEWLSSFLRTYVQRDIAVLGLSINRSLVMQLLQMISSSNGSVINYSSLSKSLGVSVTTIMKFVDILEDTFMVRRLTAYHHNIKKRIVKAPKIFIRDTGLLHTLWNTHSMKALFSHHLLGHSWEGFVIQQIATHLRDDAQLFYYRTQDGSEVDLIIVKGNKPFVSLEIKFTDNPVLTKGNHLAIEDIKAKHNFIVTPSAKEHPYNKNVRVVSLPVVLKRLQELNILI
ncbi:MAG: ATP-binding protein [Flammeovirgaceae bacterium]|jgi:predicted AAA+ superfamily ATPase|nr:ATP-binding protein [Flammeovirgaceae bacterium]